MYKTKVIKFADIRVNCPFTPARGEIGNGHVFVKKVNGICPDVDNNGQESIFWPDDKVIPVRLPSNILNKYR